MNRSPRKLSFWMLAFYLMLGTGISPVLAKAQTSSGASTAAPTTTAKASSAPSTQEIAAAKASGKVWVNTETRVYHKGGRWYGKTKQGKFMTEAEAKAAGYKAASKE
jgi:hypothetical protein